MPDVITLCPAFGRMWGGGEKGEICTWSVHVQAGSRGWAGYQHSSSSSMDASLLLLDFVLCDDSLSLFIVVVYLFHLFGLLVYSLHYVLEVYFSLPLSYHF
jgi:hypothetical protein